MEIIGGDSDLSPRGRFYAQILPQALHERLPLVQEVDADIPCQCFTQFLQESGDDDTVPLSVWTSTLKRTSQTALYLPFPKLKWKALDEISAGRCDGMSYEEIAATMPEEYKARKENKLTYR